MKLFHVQQSKTYSHYRLLRLRNISWSFLTKKAIQITSFLQRFLIYIKMCPKYKEKQLSRNEHIF